MIEWIKQHVAASVAGSVVAVGAAATVIYVVVVQPTVPVQMPVQQQEEAKKPEIRDEGALPEFPAKFGLAYWGIVNRHGEWSHTQATTISEDVRGYLMDFCDTTEKADGYCALTAPYDPKQLGIGGSAPRVKFRLHERDHHYAVIETYYHGTLKGVTWPQLRQGVKIGDATVRAIYSGDGK